MALFRSRTIKIMAALVAVLLLFQYAMPVSLLYSSLKNGTFFNIAVYNQTKPIRELSLCPESPPNLVGPINVSIRDPPTMEELVKLYPDVEAGGRWRPFNCTSRHKVAIVIPFRNRDFHLRIFLYNMHPFLQKQQLDYSIIVVNQALPTKFNRAMLMNIGFAEGIKLYDYQCFIFHDVDLIPEDDRNIYSCPQQPRHMSVAIDKFKYRLPYKGIFGGVSALNVSQFRRINGFSNVFFGWGGEDDDMSRRFGFSPGSLSDCFSHWNPFRFGDDGSYKFGVNANTNVRKYYNIARYPLTIARYKMVKHQREKGNEANPARVTLINTGSKRYSTDGLNSLVYEKLDLELRPLYTWVNVMINQTLVEQRTKKRN